MKFLQIKNNGKLLETPRILEMSVDFDTIVEDRLYFINQNTVEFTKEYKEYVEIGFDYICELSDCYQSRPLIEIDGFCEFDVVLLLNNEIYLLLASLGLFMISDCKEYEDCWILKKSQNLGSIFNQENQAKYPELYQQALKIIKNN